MQRLVSSEDCEASGVAPALEGRGGVRVRGGSCVRKLGRRKEAPRESDGLSEMRM